MIFRMQRVVMGMALAMVSAHFALADDISCEQIADETAIEMKAGANDWWSEDIARMAGMAAASACFKTRSRLTTAPREPSRSESDGESADFMGLKVKPLSGPPSRKPYERRDRD
jgi:hypothetical protein